MGTSKTRAIAITSAALLALTLAAAPAAAQDPDHLQRVMDRGLIVMSTDPLYPPQSFLDDAGEIVGNTEGSGERAAIWKPPGYALEFLGELAGGTTSRAHDLDSGGLVVGSSDDGSGDVAVVWTANGSGYDAIPLPVPAGFAGGSCTEATAISDAGR